MLADLIHHVRQELSTEIISRTILLYTQNMHDCSLSPSIQTMSAKLLLNLIDCIVNSGNKEEGNPLIHCTLPRKCNINIGSI
jgi:transformation/transcription domain-associated protein